MKLSEPLTKSSILKIVGESTGTTRVQIERSLRGASGMAAGMPGASKAAKLLKRRLPSIIDGMVRRGELVERGGCLYVPAGD